MKIKSKKGTAMVEAAIVFPLVIAAVMAILYIVIGLYQSVAFQSSLHIALRQESGQLTKTVYRLESTKKYEADNIRIGIRPAVKMEELREYRIKGLFQNKITRMEQGRSYIVNEAELIRIFTFKQEE